jgi:hypothetical protein
MSELTPQHVLANLFDSDDFSRRVPNPEEAAKIVVRRLTDSGFDIKPSEPNRWLPISTSWMPSYRLLKQSAMTSTRR